MSDGETWHCTRCKYTEKQGEILERPLTREGKIDWEALKSDCPEIRGISGSTREFFGVKVAYDEATGEPDKVAYPLGEGLWKVRKLPKSFYSVGKGSHKLFGLPLCKGRGTLLITGGEEDAMAARDMFLSSAPRNIPDIVSLPDGEQSLKAISDELSFIQGYDKIIICLDMDEPGREGAAKLSSLLSSPKVVVAELPCKDANDCLLEGKGAEFIRSLNQAKPHKPSGIIRGSELWDEVRTPINRAAVLYPWVGLNRLSYGIRVPELVTISAGSGLGKSLLCKEILFHILSTTPYGLGVISLEESVKRAATGLMSIHANKPLHLVEEDEESLRLHYDAVLGGGRVSFFDNFGTTDIDSILVVIRHMALVEGAKFILLDHVSIMVSSGEQSDERKEIDRIMTKLREIVQQLDISLFLVSHLRRPQGVGHEDGARVSLSQLRGSASIAQLSDMVIGLERDGQSEDEVDRNTTTVRVIKNRYSGLCGVACELLYDKDTGRLEESLQDF